jgi:hypothetical protein
MRPNKAGVVVPRSAIRWITPGADFGTTNHTRKQCFASVLIDWEVRKAADPGMANFRIGTLERFPFALAHGTRSSSLFESVIHRFGDSIWADHALDHFQPERAGGQWSVSLFDRMIHAPGTFRSARSCFNRHNRLCIGEHEDAAIPRVGSVAAGHGHESDRVRVAPVVG